MVLLVGCIWLCAVRLRDKYRREMSIRFETKMSKYHKVRAENKSQSFGGDEGVERLDASLVSDSNSEIEGSIEIRQDKNGISNFN